MITHWPADRITDDKSVEDRIYNAVLVEREACAKVADSMYRDCDVCSVYWDIADKIRNRK